MRVLVTWGTKMRGTEGIAYMIADELRVAGAEVTATEACDVGPLEGYDAVVVGGALYANRWHRDARRFVRQNVEALRRLPVWFFSSGPLDESAEREAIAPTREVQALMERVGARGHKTFGGCLSADVEGFPAKGGAADHAGDWRNEEQIRGWGRDLAASLETARPGVPIEHASYTVSRVLTHGLVGWGICAGLRLGVFSAVNPGLAIALHAVAVPLVFIVVSWHYFAPVATRTPAAVALTFAAMVATLDLVVIAGVMERNFAMFKSVTGMWLPLALIFVVTYVTGTLIAILPVPTADKGHVARASHA